MSPPRLRPPIPTFVLVLVLEIDPSIRRDSAHFDYEYEHERRFAEHEGRLASTASPPLGGEEGPLSVSPARRGRCKRGFVLCGRPMR